MEKVKTIIGVRGYGKSVLALGELKRIAKQGKCATLLLDRPGTLARAAVGHACSIGLQKRVLYEQASRLDRTLQWPFWQAQIASNPLEQENLNAIADEQFAQGFLAIRGLKDAEQKPWTKQYLMGGTATWRSQPIRAHLMDILAPFEMGNLRRRPMLEAAQERNAARLFTDLEFRSARMPNTYSVESGAAYRMLHVVRSPALWARNAVDLRNSLDWEWVIQNKIQVYMDLSGVPREVARALGIFAYTGFNNAIVRVAQRTGKQHPGAVYLEEAGAMDFVTPYVLSSMQEDRKWGSSWTVISQTVEDFKGEGTFETLMGLSEEAYFFRMNTGIDRAAEALANPTYDPNTVHRTDTKYGLIGHETIETINVGERLDKHGKVIGKDRRKIETTRPIYGGVKHDVMKTPQLHKQDYMTELAKVPIGSCFYAGNGVQLINVKMEPDPWPLNLTNLRTDRAIEAIRQSRLYQPPTPPESLRTPAPQPAVSPPTPPRNEDASHFFDGGN